MKLVIYIFSSLFILASLLMMAGAVLLGIVEFFKP